MAKPNAKPAPVAPEFLFSLHLKKNPDFAAAGGVLHRWDETCWRPLDSINAERLAYDFLETARPDRATASTAQACVATAALAVQTVPERGKGVVIPCQNGYVHIGENGNRYPLAMPSKVAGLTYSLACRFDELADAPQFAAFIKSVLPDDDVRSLVQEYIGYSLMGDTRFQKAQMWLGSGSNGKGTLAQIVAALHSKVCAISLDDLSGFGLAGMIGASLLYADETPARVDEQRLKTLISGDLIQIDRKYRDPLSLRPTGKFICCANAVPSVSDQSYGFWRRWHVIPFIVQFKEVDQDVTLARRVVDGELSGVLNWAIEGLQRLLERGRFAPLPAAVADAIEGGQRDSNSVMSWWQDVEPAFSSSFQLKSQKEDVYEHYALWCKANGFKCCASNKFWERTKQIAGDSLLERKFTVLSGMVCGGTGVPRAVRFVNFSFDNNLTIDAPGSFRDYKEK